MDTTEQTRADEVRAFIARTPLAQEMGLRCEVMGDEMTMIMPYQEKLIGNFMIKAIHGGAIAAFLELT
ncbi:PaaI family thioesterase, partial [Hyphomonas sp. UBA3988]